MVANNASAKNAQTNSVTPAGGRVGGMGWGSVGWQLVGRRNGCSAHKIYVYVFPTSTGTTVQYVHLMRYGTVLDSTVENTFSSSTGYHVTHVRTERQVFWTQRIRGSQEGS